MTFDEWQAVVMAGALGGAVTTFLPSGMDFPWPKPFRAMDGYGGFALNLVRNSILGALASFLMWALADPNQPFSGGSASVGQVASGIIVGGAGGSIINNFFRQAQQTAASDEVITSLSEVLDEALEERNGIESDESRQEGTAGVSR